MYTGGGANPTRSGCGLSTSAGSGLESTRAWSFEDAGSDARGAGLVAWYARRRVSGMVRGLGFPRMVTRKLKAPSRNFFLLGQQRCAVFIPNNYSQATLDHPAQSYIPSYYDSYERQCCWHSTQRILKSTNLSANKKHAGFEMLQHLLLNEVALSGHQRVSSLGSARAMVTWSPGFGTFCPFLG